MNPFDLPNNASSPSTSFIPLEHPRLSKTAVASLVTAILSPLGACFCYPTLIGSAIALLLGHVAVFQIWRSAGKQWGAVWAVLSLVIAYPLFGISVLSLVISAMPKPAVIPPTPAQAALSAAESKIFSDSQGTAHGNTPEAQELAATFSKRIKTLRDEFFTKSGSKMKLSGDNFVTFCQLEKDRCAFLVHAPDLRHFEGDAKQTLSELAWSVGNSLAADELEPGDQLGVGIKGVFLYSAVMVGQVDADADTRRTSTNSADLLPFFTSAPLPPTAPATDPTLVPTEAAETPAEEIKLD